MGDRQGVLHRRLARRLARRAAVLALAGLVLTGPVLPAPARAADPWDVLDDATLERLAQDLQAGRDARALAETLRATLAAKDQEIAELREALAAAKRQEAATLEERIRQDEREKLRAESVGLLKDALAEYREALKEAREENRALRKQATVERVLSLIPLVGAALILFGVGR